MQQGFIKLTRKTLVSYLIIFLVFSGTGLVYLFNPFGTKQAEAAWFNDDWSYRKAVPVTDDTSETNKYITISSYDASDTAKYQTDCGDVRFTDQSGKLLVYTVSSCGASTTFHVNMPSLTTTTQTIYLYYGNPSVSDGFAASDPYSAASGTITIGTVGSEEKGTTAAAYWKFDDGQGTTAQDSTTNNRDATLAATTSTPTWQTEDQCIAGKCLYFDGTNDYASVSSWTPPTGPQSYAAWIRTDSSSEQGITTFADAAPAGVTSDRTLSVTSTGTVKFVITTSGGAPGNATSTRTVNDGKWHYVVGLFDGNAIKVYIDGLADGSTGTSTTTGYTGYSTPKFNIGNIFNGSLKYFNGFIDEVKVYNYALSSSQVQANYNARQNPDGLAGQLGNDNKNNAGALSNGLVGYWKMDESSWTNDCSTTSVIDSSGSGNNGKACPSSSGPTGGAAGKFGNAGSFDGTDDYVDVASSSNISPTSAMTFSSWVNPTSLSSSFRFIGKKGNGLGGNNDQYALLSDNNGDCSGGGNHWAFFIWSGGNASFICALNNTPATGSWVHVTGTYDGSHLNIYINGVLDSSTSASGQIQTTSNDLVLGANGNTSNNFSGQVDEVRIYNRALSSSEVSQLYNFAPGPVGYWKMDEGSGTNANDSSGNAYNGTLTNMATNPSTTASGWTNGKYGGGLKFDGSDDYVTTTNNAAFDPTVNYVTVEAWVKPTSTTTLAMVSKGGTSGGWTIFSSSGTPTILFKQAGSGTNAYQKAAGTAFTTNTWQHLAVAFRMDTSSTTNNDAQFYLNGSLTNGSATNTAAAGTSTANLKFGVRGPNGSESLFWNGFLDDVKIYNYQRTSAQIVEDMNAGHPAPGSPVGTPVGHWRFDEGYGLTTGSAHNSGNCGSTCDGTITGITQGATSGWTNLGKFGKALNFDGTDDYVAMPSDITPLKITGPITLSAWINLSDNTATHHIIAKFTGTASTSSYDLFTDSSGKLNMRISDGATITTVTGVKVLSTSTWYYVAGVYDPGSAVTLYINGIQDKRTTSSIPSSLQNTTTILDIGAQNGGTNPFQGTIDEPKIYNQALTTDQINTDMNRGASEVLGAVSVNSSNQPNSAANEYCIPGDTATCTSPVGRWDFDEGSGTNAQDSSGNGNTGTITAGTGGYINGKVNKGYNFDGADTSVNAGSGSSLDDLPSSGMTVEAWINPRSCGEDIGFGVGNKVGFIAAKNNGAGQNAGWIFSCFNAFGSANALELDVDGASDLTANTVSNAITLNKWQHVALSWGGDITSASSVHFYVNGVEVSHNSTTNGSSRVSDAASSLYIGNASSSDRTIDGGLDQVRVFNYARTPSQIAWDYDKGAPVAWYKMDECQGTAIHDNSGNGNIGTWTGSGGSQTSAGTCQTSSTAWGNGATGKRNYALNFDASDDKIDVSPASSINEMPDHGGLSISAWVYPQSCGQAVFSGNASFLVAKNNGDSQSSGWILACVNVFGPVNVLEFVVDGIPFDLTVDSASNILTFNTWQHVVLTWDGNMSTPASVHMYINNKEVSYGTQNGGSTRASDSTSHLTIGNSTSTDRTWDGMIDDVRVYNYPLTTAQINQIYNDGAVTYQPVTGAP